MKNDPASQDLITDLVSGWIRRAVRRGRSEVERAAEGGRRRLELRQMRKDLDHFWIRLGKTAQRLVEAGEIDHPALRKAMTRIEELERELDQALAARGVSQDAVGDVAPPAGSE